MNRTFVLVPIAALLTGVSCKDPAADKPKAETGEAVVQGAAPAGAGLSFSNDGSTVAFTGSKVTGKHDGVFETFQGRITLGEGDLTTGQVTVEIDTASVKTDSPKLDGHLKSPDFFDVDKHPKAVFVSTAIKAGGEGGASHTVTGNLTLHGVTKSITFPAKIMGDASHVMVNAEFAINRKDFNIVYPGMPDDLIRDDVAMRLEIHANK